MKNNNIQMHNSQMNDNEVKIQLRVFKLHWSKFIKVSFKKRLKDVIDSANFISTGGSFQSQGALGEKVQSPLDLGPGCGTTRKAPPEDLKSA